MRALARTHLSYTDQKGTVTQQMWVLRFEQYIPVTVYSSPLRLDPETPQTKPIATRRRPWRVVPQPMTPPGTPLDASAPPGLTLDELAHQSGWVPTRGRYSELTPVGGVVTLCSLSPGRAGDKAGPTPGTPRGHTGPPAASAWRPKGPPHASTKVVGLAA